MRLLVVEDDRALSAAVAQALREGGFAVDVAASGTEGLRMAKELDYSLVVLDLLLPGLHGLEVLRELRAAGRQVPVLVLSALDQVRRRVEGLDRGADDYLSKPFALSELLARVRALLRRAALHVPESVVHLGNLEVDLARREVWRDGREIALTAREYRILVYLLARRGQPVTREEIGTQVIDRGYEPASNAIDVSICGLRSKLGEPTLVQTVRGVGYRLAAPRSG
jgi:two-component system copper resistance phosphate regulon response regulator CusR